jgi:flagellum-specific ATP synthase
MSEHVFVERLRSANLISRTGRVRRALPTALEADGPNLPLGGLCDVETGTAAGASGSMLAEVVGVSLGGVTLAPLEDAAKAFVGASVRARSGLGAVPVGDGFLGRAVDGLGRPLDGAGPIAAEAHAPLDGALTAPLSRLSPRRPAETGVRAIDGLLTLGEGQRVGIFAASGVGKTSLLTQIASNVVADRCVVCLVGERGREIESLWTAGLPPAQRARSTLVASPSDQTAAMRVRAARYAFTLAGHWRDRGHHVLLLLDSVTRLAMALREIGLAAGEPPTVRAYTPGVFAAIPRLIERCGAVRSGGAITAVITVLAETDDADDPICELMKSLLDGHIMLSRDLAEQGHFPAIDAPRSVSRLADDVAPRDQRANAADAIGLLARYEASRTLIETGVYASGASADIDRAIARRPHLAAFLRQDVGERSTLAATQQALAQAVGAGA